MSEENANLVLELNLRPSTKQVHSLQRQVQALQRQLARAKARCQEHDGAMPTPEDPPLGEPCQIHALDRRKVAAWKHGHIRSAMSTLGHMPAHAC